MPTCPACGMKTNSTDTECSRCGWNFERTGKFDCPFCGDLISIKSKRCPACKADLSQLTAKARAESIERFRGMLLADFAEMDSSDGGKSEAKYGCPKCATLLHGTEAKCPHCGQLLIGKAGVRCPICGTYVGKRKKQCPMCGTSLSRIIETALPMVPLAPESEPETIDNKTLESSITKECPICGAQVPEDLKKCPLCGADFLEGPPLAQEQKVEAETIPEPIPAQDAAPQTEVASAVGEAEKPVEAPAETVAGSSPEPQVQPRPETRIASKRRVKPEMVTTVDLGGKPSARGLSNGLGGINGTGRTNGTGAINGRAFVNGSGVSNGLQPSSRQSRQKRKRGFSRWQALALLVAFMILIPAFLFLSFSSQEDVYSIDGDFSEWDGATIFGTKVSSASPTNNVTGWAVASQGSSLFLYFGTQEPMMSSPEAESYYLFVDSDGSNSTGYVMESIGAEYMIRLTGWNNTVDSASLYEFSSSDRLDWNAWRSSSSVVSALDGTCLEAKAALPSSLGSSSRFLLMSKDSMERGAVSFTAPLKGSLLVVEQLPAAEVALDGLVPQSSSVQVLTLRFTSHGGRGSVEQITPTVAGASLVTQIASFSLENGETRSVPLLVDTSAASYGQLMWAEVLVSGIASSYKSVEIIGSRVSAYVGSSPATIAIDGAFSDWTGLLSADSDSVPVKNPNVDIAAVGNVSTLQNSFFYVSVDGKICSGTYVPVAVARPSGSSGGGAGILTRSTAEDMLRIWVDSDRSNMTGEPIALGSKRIGADQMIEVRGLFGRITSTGQFSHSSSGWVKTPSEMDVAKDDKRIEIGVTASSLGGHSDIDFIVETTSWKGREDLATSGTTAMTASTLTWVVDSVSTSPYATSMSYQRKMFYDGLNFWSFFFDGTNTVCKYSVDGGMNWVYSGRVFITSGVNETSIWYDPSTSMVYAVGDTSIPSRQVSIQMGIVNAAAHKISWATSDANLTASINPIAGKNTYISKDPNGYLWVLATNWVQLKPQQHDLTAYRSLMANSTSSWLNTGGVLPYGMYESNSKGSIVPAGSGSDMWAVYTYAGNVAAKKYTGSWPVDWDEVLVYKADTSWANTETSPPSVVVDGKGVVHVVYGTGRANRDKVSIPQIFYSHNNTNSITFTAGLNLDPTNDTQMIANYYPTISLDTSTSNLYVFWVQCDSSFNPTTVLGRRCASGIWSAFGIDEQTSFTKQYLTSIYSVSGVLKICWQWTQNTTAPIDVMFDVIPEFSDMAFSFVGFVVIVAVIRDRTRSKGRT